MADRSSDMTLAFSLEALQQLADPAVAIDDAREWSQYVGAVSAAPNGALSFTKERRIRLDFFSGTRPPAETLYAVKGNYRTERYVFVGVDGQRDLAESRHWEFQHVEDAADRAGWALTDVTENADDSGILGRLLARLGSALDR
ncbi:hypothetical protein L593_13825 [Salinarchaeum sp. Harcht-Bsk1]|uniref:DUF7124 domain-containing protein n=1 Tax=Salinarchaeum sp. Harcht-Bsk1 TaxID=1333523 RepID=UPI00034241E8|nr:hypothetical protein [Salinarchaeum sp. Harcht-Bsk1]AGN02704.1 hypothetical protein L593_13825 [Salinarchaeum sp. Harcht-Bsk1]